MKKWKIPVVWQMMGFVTVEADTLEEAMFMAENDDSIPLPNNGDFIDGSFELDCRDEDYVRECYNDGQEDDENEKMS